MKKIKFEKCVRLRFSVFFFLLSFIPHYSSILIGERVILAHAQLNQIMKGEFCRCLQFGACALACLRNGYI